MNVDAATVGTRVRTTRDFSGVPEGTEGVIDEDYGSGVMVAWDLPARSLPERYDEHLPIEPAERPMSPEGYPVLRDGFDKESELRFLEVVEDA